LGAPARLELEGIMAKAADDCYDGRTESLKIKNRRYPQLHVRRELFGSKLRTQKTRAT